MVAIHSSEILVPPPSSEKSKKSPSTLKNGTVQSSEFFGILYHSRRRFTSQDWNIRVRICSIVPVVSSLMREPIRVSILLTKFAIGRLQSITWSVTFPLMDEDGKFTRTLHWIQSWATKSSCLGYIFSVTSEFILSHMGGCYPKLIFSKISCAFLTSFTSLFPFL